MAKKTAVTEQVSVPAKEKEITMLFPNLNNNTHILRILGQDGKIACELRFEKDVFGWDKTEKRCDNSRLRLEIMKPISEDNMKLVKEFRVCTNLDSRIIWLGDRILKESKTTEVESV